MDEPIRRSKTEVSPVAHTGSSNIPESMREFPVEEFDMSLQEAVETGKVSTLPMTETHLVSPENKKRKKGLILGIGGGAIALATTAALVVGLNLPKNNETSNEGTPPDDETTTSEITPPSVEEGVVPELITTLENQDWETFQIQPRTDQLVYATYKVTENEATHEKLVGTRNRTIWTEPTKGMSGQQIVDNFNYVRDDAGMAVKIDSEGNKILDKDEAIKRLSGAYYDTSGITTNAFLSDRDFILNQDKMFITDQVQTVVEESDVTLSDDREGNPVELKLLKIQDQLGNQYTTQYAYVEYIDIDNSTKSDWLLFTQNLDQ